MRAPPDSPPETLDDHALHARLLARDPLAPSELAERHLEPLVRALDRRFPTVDPHLVESAAIDVLLSVAERPEQCDLRKGNLGAYLRMAARGDVLNRLRAERRRTGRLVSLDADVEVARRVGNSQGDGQADPSDLVAQNNHLPGGATLARVRASFPDAREWQAVQLMLAGERRTAAYARLLGLAGLSEIEQARTVKRVKDRLQKRLQRLGDRLRSEVPGDG